MMARTSIVARERSCCSGNGSGRERLVGRQIGGVAKDVTFILSWLITYFIVPKITIEHEIYSFPGQNTLPKESIMLSVEEARIRRLEISQDTTTNHPCLP
jgi:hypothetical protein